MKMTNHLDGTYYIIDITQSDGAYFIPVEEGQRIDALLENREGMDPDDQSATIVFHDLAGLRTRLFISEIAALQLSTPEQRIITREMTHELRARNIDL